MSDITSTQLASVIATFAKETPEGEVTTVPLDPLCTTFAFGRYWVKALKKTPTSRDFSPLHREFLALDWLVRQNRATLDYKLHVPVPAPIKVDASGAPIPEIVLIMRRPEGRPLIADYARGARLSDADCTVYGDQIGRYMARVHAVNAKGAGLIGVEKTGIHPGPWAKYYNAMLDAQWKRLLGSGLLPDEEMNALHALVESKHALLVGETSSLSHNDFQMANIYVDPAEKKVTALVNFQNAGVATPMVDFVTFFVHTPDPVFWKAFVDGYEKIRSVPDKFHERLPYYAVPFALYAALMMAARQDEAGKGYYLRRALEAAAHFDASYQGIAARYAAFERPRMG